MTTPPPERRPEIAAQTHALICRLIDVLDPEVEIDVVLSALLFVTVEMLIVCDVDLEPYIDRLRLVCAERAARAT